MFGFSGRLNGECYGFDPTRDDYLYKNNCTESGYLFFLLVWLFLFDIGEKVCIDRHRNIKKK